MVAVVFALMVGLVWLLVALCGCWMMLFGLLVGVVVCAGMLFASVVLFLGLRLRGLLIRRLCLVALVSAVDVSNWCLRVCLAFGCGCLRCVLFWFARLVGLFWFCLDCCVFGCALVVGFVWMLCCGLIGVVFMVAVFIFTGLLVLGVVWRYYLSVG